MKPLLALPLLLCTGLALAQPATDCLSQTQRGSEIVLSNRCDGPISVAICAPGAAEGSFLRACGDGGPLNKFYTDAVALAAGESKVVMATSLRTASCRGTGSAIGLGGFSSDESGQFKCPPRSTSARRVGETFPHRSQATSTQSQARACELAREAFAADARSTEPCDCTQRQGSHVVLYACSSSGRGAESGLFQQARRSLTELLQDLLQEVSGCDPTGDDRQCVRQRRTTNPGGVRG